MSFDIRADQYTAERAAENAREWLARNGASEPEPESPPAHEPAPRPSQRPGEGACVYIMKCGPYYKVGRATNVMTRLGSIQGACPFDVSLALMVFTTPRGAGKAEYAAHQTLARYRHRSEWFRAPFHVIRAAVIDAVKAAETKLYPRVEWTTEGKVTDLTALRLPAHGLRPCKKGERPIKGVPRSLSDLPPTIEAP